MLVYGLDSESMQERQRQRPCKGKLRHCLELYWIDSGYAKK
jgi:hypothetical protein